MIAPDEFKLWDAHYVSGTSTTSWYDIAPFDGTTQSEVQLINNGFGPEESFNSPRYDLIVRQDADGLK